MSTADRAGNLPRVIRPILQNKLEAEELRKLYAEILQLDNQRFLLSTTAVVVFGTVCGWVTTALLRGGPPTGAGTGQRAAEFLPLASVWILWLVLISLFRLALSKAHTIRWLAAYLLLQGSKWEWTWHEFRKMDHGHSFRTLPFHQVHRAAAGMFSALMYASLLYFSLLQAYVVGIDETAIFLIQALLGAWAFTYIVLLSTARYMYLSARQLLQVDEKSYMECWARAESKGREERLAWGGIGPGEPESPAYSRL